MNWYEVALGDADCSPDGFFADDQELFALNQFDLTDGTVITAWDERSLLRSTMPEYDGTPDDILENSLVVPVFSRRLRVSLSESGVAVRDIQYLPIHILRSTGEDLSGYSVANVIARVPALDRDHSSMLHVDHSTIDPLTGMSNVRGIWPGTAALKGSVLGEHDVIRLLEFFPPIFVSERFVEAFSRGGFTGATFRSVPVY